MTPIAHDIVDCLGFEIVKSLPWDLQGGKIDDCEDKHQASERSNWGFLICIPSDSMLSGDESDADRLYGVVGQIQTDCIQETCLGIPLKGALDPQSALSHFALACGLSIIDRAKLELGDTIVVAGANPLALSVLVAAKRQGARTACLVPNSEAEATYRLGIEQLADALVEFRAMASFDSKLDTFVASSRGKTVYVDAVGLPNLVRVMASRLEMLGTLVLCRQEVITSLQIDIQRYVHFKSAQIIYWSRPENLEEALAISECYRRTARLFYWKRISVLTGVISAGLDASL